MAGINKTLYNNEDDLEYLLTKKEAMNSLHIKDSRTFMKLVAEKRIPYLTVGKEYLFPLKKFNQWIKNNTIG